MNWGGLERQMGRIGGSGELVGAGTVKERKKRGEEEG